MTTSRLWRASGAALLTTSWAACMAAPSGEPDSGQGRQPLVEHADHGIAGAGATEPGTGATAGTGPSSSSAGGGGGSSAGGSTSSAGGSTSSAGGSTNSAGGSTSSAGGSTSSAGGSSGGAGGDGGAGGEGDDPTCACPVGEGEYLPAGQPNPCGAKESRDSCQAAMCTVAIGDPDDDEPDLWRLRNCTWPPPPPNPPGDCACPVGQGEYLPDDPDSNHCVGKTSRNSCQMATCTVLVGDPNDGKIDPIALRQCGWPPPPPNPIGPCMCPVGAGEYLPEESDCAGIADAGTCGGTWCTVAVGDPTDSDMDYWLMRPCDWLGPDIVIAASHEQAASFAGAAP